MASSLASSVSSTTVLSLNQSVGNGATKKSAAAAKPKQAQAQAAALKKVRRARPSSPLRMRLKLTVFPGLIQETDEAERKKAMRDLQERRLAAQKKKEEKEQKKQEEERRAKAQELERKRKEREEAVAKAKASAARLAAKREVSRPPRHVENSVTLSQLSSSVRDRPKRKTQRNERWNKRTKFPSRRLQLNLLDL